MSAVDRVRESERFYLYLDNERKLTDTGAYWDVDTGLRFDSREIIHIFIRTWVRPDPIRDQAYDLYSGAHLLLLFKGFYFPHWNGLLHCDLFLFTELLIYSLSPISKSQILPKQSLPLTASSNHCPIFLLCLIAKVFNKFICWINFLTSWSLLILPPLLSEAALVKVINTSFLLDPKVSSPALCSQPLSSLWHT